MSFVLGGRLTELKWEEQKNARRLGISQAADISREGDYYKDCDMAEG